MPNVNYVLLKLAKINYVFRTIYLKIYCFILKIMTLNELQEYVFENFSIIIIQGLNNSKTVFPCTMESDIGIKGRCGGQSEDDNGK